MTRPDNNEPEGKEREGDYVAKEPVKTDLDVLIEEYKSEAEQRDTTPKMYVYRYENEKVPKENDAEMMGCFFGNDIPEKHKIGLLYGGGRYRVHLKQPAKNGKGPDSTTVIIKISHAYDKLKADFDEQTRREEAARLNENSRFPGSGSPAQIPAAVQGSTFGETFVMLKEILSIIMPVVKIQSAAPAPVPAPDMMAQYGTMQKILQKNLFDTAETYRTFSRRFQSDEPEEPGIVDNFEPEEEPKGINIVEKIVKMIEPFFVLLAQKGPAGQVAAEAARAAPQFAEVLSDPQLCRFIVQYFDKTKGIDKANQALANLGINRQALFAATKPGPGGHASSQPQPAAPRRPGRQPTGKAALPASSRA